MSGFIPSTLAPENWPFSLEWLPQPAYMVGGAVRDAMLGRSREYLDLDFVIPSDAVKVARTIAHRYQAGFVLLDPVRRIARVVFPQATADFAQQEGDSLETDLHRRDFTVNAIAYNPHTQEIIDPLNGCADLQAGVLRMIAKANLKDDPLRLLRAYRQAAQLGFTIEPATQAAIRDLASQLCQVAAERVRVEIGYLLASPQGHTWMAIAENDGLLKQFFPNTTPESFRKLAVVDEVADLLTKHWPQLGAELQGYVRETVKTTWLGIAKLACLVHPDPRVAEIELQKLTYSRAEIRAVTTALKLFPQLKTANTQREQYFVFQEAGMVFAAIAVLALVQDTLVEAMSGDNRLSAYSPLITRYLNPDDLVAHPTQLVSGKNLMIALDIPPSPLVGELLTEIAIARIEGKVTTTEAAIAFARQLLKG
ncbi:Polynucleotide adenylyltransferase region [Trichormus variabilis ATCC 29413]|uniref:Polynucleotide adenylyltransferase region n=2 Tax=Anabaena variabilis TaxID=264691 RepID=Q3M6E8_TRIV2|nr:MULTISPECIES: CCA tRNA nucleotidyltransferase [Nostocaceae]ABA23438.1 Polynucleotide adenylyltransferase region [Trichormus variabilis ATCC 29413]MBC1216762.1 CCA tRNA nucleotidyltransferase [Trichormus variabilis ARAD]MBC1255829.1 CCA tRNA nucleotidyltransferase [Trichormus variabilis V5]MBC1267509.1 CCA tRNA nucleotidyltransferase [Trichormus variabilis FSR]MBC1302743.1 CCA tRNA nucleotidyltransferase [Trichormus variabilis N2B]